MSFIPLKTQRNRGWWDGDRSQKLGMRYLAPCAGVTDNAHTYEYDCATAISSSSSTTTTTTDLCGRPFRPGPNYVPPTASGEGVTCGGRPKA